MRAIVVEIFGSAKNLTLRDVNKPAVSPGKVLVKIIRAGVNPVDTYIREGCFINLPKLPFILGKDASGIVEGIGENVSKFKVGQRVFLCGRKLGQSGTYAEYIVVSEEDVFPLDDKLTFDQGAALGVPYFTAYRALVLKAKCKEGETVLVHGATGAVGIATVQLAKKLGLKVIGTAGTAEGKLFVKENGADYVLSHKESCNMESIYEITDNDGVDIIIEMLANANLDNDLNYLAKKGRVAVVGSRGPLKMDARKMMSPETEIIGVALLSSSKEEWEQTSKAILDGITEGWVKPIVDKSYPLKEAQKAHEDVASSRGKKGKIVLAVQEP